MLKSEIFVSAARRNVLVGVVVFLFVILVGKLYYLQIYQFEKYRELADFNRIRLITTYAPRGKILDRHGKVLAANRSVYTISVIPDEVANRQELDLIADYLGSKGEEIESSLKKYSRGPFLPARVAREIPVERLGYIEEHRAQLPGVMYSEFPIRLYPQQVRANASHVLGYLRE
ncbi:MAG: penicillin-binding protein 2, partial [Fidelibacterota bacterium]